ncbi:hypothetical protein GON03_05415 [Nocardioides sp. MAH-18]|uniref:Uncharacterized protein n=1 Tax=Nocardioides agri TaxID=2682843 RepID=A0A6L6XMT2_9ACTN|nr:MULTISPECIES: hypothetical protein [unclassified Nocardioides]MBA2953747.1 hypothetical protein [Nocardioides sp. CGMCC 1.13656]MVQ48611.1 hypothetical protein [Nocardioides sp. MAH-18]
MSVNAYGRFGDTDSGAASDSAVDGTRRPASQGGVDDALESSAAARLLEMTAGEVEKWRAEAEDEAAAIVASARIEAAEVVRAAGVEADRVISAARAAAGQTMNDARVQADRVRDETTALRNRADAEIAHLQRVESDHRHQLRQHLTEMLDRVDTPAEEDHS